MEIISPRFGKARLYRQDIGVLERMYFKLFGLADPGHYIRSEYFKRYLRGLSPSRILDAGCGSGDYSFYLAERFPLARVIGIDRNATIIERNLRTRDNMGLTNLDFRVQDLGTFDESNSYDLITCIDVLQYIDKPETVILTFAKALRKDGFFYLHLPLLRRSKVPLQRFLTTFHTADNAAVKTKITKDEIIRMIMDANLTVEKSQHTFAYYAGELACSLSCSFYKNTHINRFMQALISPFGRMLGWFELRSCPSNGFAVGLLARKPR